MPTSEFEIYFSGPTFNGDDNISVTIETLKNFNAIYKAASQTLKYEKSSLKITGLRIASLSLIFQTIYDAYQQTLALYPDISNPHDLIKIAYEQLLQSASDHDLSTLDFVRAFVEVYNIRKKLINIGSHLQRDDDQLNIKSNGKKLITLKKSDVKILKSQEADSKKSTNFDRVTLAVKNPNLIGRGPWKFVYQDNNISAQVPDDFQFNVTETREEYKAGDFLLCDIEEVETEVNGKKKKIYRIVKVYKKL